MDLRLFIDKKSVIATLIIIVISIVIIATVTIVRSNNINPPLSNTSSLSKGSDVSSTSFLIGHSNAQKQEEEQQLQQKHIVPLDQIVSSGPPPDGIPSIDNPKFVNLQGR